MQFTIDVRHWRKKLMASMSKIRCESITKWNEMKKNTIMSWDTETHNLNVTHKNNHLHHSNYNFSLLLSVSLLILVASTMGDRLFFWVETRTQHLIFLLFFFLILFSAQHIYVVENSALIILFFLLSIPPSYASPSSFLLCSVFSRNGRTRADYYYAANAHNSYMHV